MSRSSIAMLALLGVLVAANIGTGTALVITTQKSRALFQERELLRREEDRLRGDWSALQIEVTSLASHSEIDRTAHDELGMIEPDSRLQYVPANR
jgi:cell division protein FtsL